MHDVAELISIIIPVYNVKKYLDRCIKSVVEQSYSHIEIIIVDDGSNDGSSRICDTWEQKDKRIRVFHKSNAGVSSARNMGLEKTRGEFIGFVDSDDYIKQDMYATLVESMDEGIDITCCGTVNIDTSRRNKQLGAYGMASQKVFFSKAEAIANLLMQGYLSFSPCDKLYRRKLFEGVRFPVGRTCEDLPVIYELIKRSHGIVHTGRAEYFYCYRKDSVSKREFFGRRIDFVLFAGEICKDVKENYPQCTMQAEALYIEIVVYTIQCIQACKDRSKYTYLEKRLKKVLRHMYIRIIYNTCIPLVKKQQYLLIGTVEKCIGP